MDALPADDQSEVLRERIDLVSRQGPLENWSRALDQEGLERAASVALEVVEGWPRPCGQASIILCVRELLGRSMSFCCRIWSTLDTVQYSTSPEGRFRNMNVKMTGMNSIILA